MEKATRDQKIVGPFLLDTFKSWWPAPLFYLSTSHFSISHLSLSYPLLLKKPGINRIPGSRPLPLWSAWATRHAGSWPLATTAGLRRAPTAALWARPPPPPWSARVAGGWRCRGARGQLAGGCYRGDAWGIDLSTGPWPPPSLRSARAAGRHWGSASAAVQEAIQFGTTGQVFGFISKAIQVH